MNWLRKRKAKIFISQGFACIYDSIKIASNQYYCKLLLINLVSFQIVIIIKFCDISLTLFFDYIIFNQIDNLPLTRWKYIGYRFIMMLFH